MRILLNPFFLTDSHANILSVNTIIITNLLVARLKSSGTSYYRWLAHLSLCSWGLGHRLAHFWLCGTFHFIHFYFSDEYLQFKYDIAKSAESSRSGKPIQPKVCTRTSHYSMNILPDYGHSKRFDKRKLATTYYLIFSK